MMQYIWMTVWAFILMLATTLLIGWGLRRCRKDFPLSEPDSFVSGCVLLVVGTAPAIVLAIEYDALMRLLFMFIVAWSILFCQLKMKGLLREVIYMALCFAVLPFLPANPPLFPGMFGYLTYPFLGISAYVMMRIFSLLDRVSWLSILTLLAQGLLFYLVRLFPISVMEFLFYEFIIAMTIAQSMNVVEKRVVLGDFAAPLVGFFLGYAWLFIVSKGYIYAPLMGFSYDILELVFAVVMALLAERQIWPPADPFLMEKALENSPKKAVRYIFFVLVMLSAFTFLYIRQGVTYGFLLVFFVFLFSVYWMLKQWGTPRPSFRDLAKDIKDGLGALKEEINYVPLKENGPQKVAKKVAPAKKSQKKGKKGTRK